jgi:hypothetical protein
LLPIFLLFVVAHIFAIGLGIVPKTAEIPLLASGTYQKTIGDIQDLGFWATLFIVLHAYSLGGGTYTGIEAVSNGFQALREPRVETGKKTMLYMAAIKIIDAHRLPGLLSRAPSKERAWPS